jgi:TolB-like protein
VLVLWSKEAVNSRWVRDEASVAADSQRLVSATVDGTAPPLGFRQFQTIDLRRWTAKGAPIPSELAEALEVDTPTQSARRPAGVKRTPIVAGLGALLLIGAATVAIVRPAPLDDWLSGESESDGLSLAIMPFVTQGGAGIDYLGPGLASALADSLTPLSGLKITASTSTGALAGQRLTAPEIAEKLGVTHLVEGNVQKAGDRYNISVRLIGAKSSEQVWARSFEGTANELQVLKTRMARELAGALTARLGVGQGEVIDRGRVDPRAYEAYLRALERVSVRDNRDARVEAIRQFRLATSIEPDFADAHAGHAYLLALSTPDHLGTSWSKLIADQQRVTARALQLDPDNDLALIARSTALKNFFGDADQALPIDRAVLERSPNLVAAHYSIAASLWMQGHAREALDHLDLAIDRDPFDNLLQFYRIKILYSLGDYEATRDAARKCSTPCAGAGWFWYLAMVGFGTQAQYREDIAEMKERSAAEGVSAEDMAEAWRIAEALMFGRTFALKPLENEQTAQFVDAALEARLVNFGDGLRLARNAADIHHADDALDMLNEGRVTFTPEQRADPRYHALFRHPKLAKIEAARRKNGVTAGLPVFPVKPYTGR